VFALDAEIGTKARGEERGRKRSWTMERGFIFFPLQQTSIIRVTLHISLGDSIHLY
jgi:hypothetical protein